LKWVSLIFRTKRILQTIVTNRMFDSNLFCCNKNLSSLESNINSGLIHVSTWLAANKLSLNIDKTNFVIFHPPQKIIKYSIHLYINNQIIKQEKNY
jgi:hypothetical protein